MATKFITEKDILKFGKFRGETAEFVFHYEPSYLIWAHNTIDWFLLEPEFYTKIWNQLERDKLDKETDSVDFSKFD